MPKLYECTTVQYTVPTRGRNKKAIKLLNQELRTRKCGSRELEQRLRQFIA